MTSASKSLNSDLQTRVREILDGSTAHLGGIIEQSTAALAEQQQNNHDEILQALSSMSCSTTEPQQQIRANPFPGFVDQKAAITENFILQQLTFREISDRADSIDQANKDSFKWIYSHTPTT